MRKRDWAIGLTAGVLLAGCGGSGQSGQVATTPRSDRSVGGVPDGNTRAEGQNGRAGIFICATGAASAAHLWLNVRRVELITLDEKPVIVYEEQDGAGLDLNALATSKKFALLTCATVPSGKSYVRARVTFGGAASQFAPLAPTAQSVPFADSLARDAQENPIISFSLTRPRDIGNGRENLVIAIDLAKTEIKNGRITPSLREGTPDGLSDLTRQIPATFSGTVQEALAADKTDTMQAASTVEKSAKPAIPETTKEALPAPAPTPPPAKTETTPKVGSAPTFTLEVGTNRRVTVETSDATVFDNESAMPSPAVANGKKVQVRGVLDIATKRIVAQRVTVLAKETATGEITTLRGTLQPVAKSDLQLADSAGVFTVTTKEADGMMPAFAAVTVQMAPDAVYRSSGGLLLTNEEFISAVRSSPSLVVAVSGVYEPITGTLRGTRAIVESANVASHEVEVTGTASGIAGKENALTITKPALWQGIALTETTTLAVTTTVATDYRDEKGEFIAQKNFFAKVLTGEATVRAIGLYANGTLTATRLTLVPSGTKPADTAIEKPEEKPTPAPASDVPPANGPTPAGDSPA